MDVCYGFCMDGHLHRIKTQFLDIAQKHKSHFESNMFTKAEVDEHTISNHSFIPLPPTNCPDLGHHLPFGRLMRKNRLPNKPTSPFRIDELHERTPVAFLMSFEEHSDRISETKEEGKLKLYHLIQDAMLSLKPDHVDQLSYETLREMFLRKFWNIKYQEEVYAEFLKSSYPAFRGQKVRDYVYYWLHRSTFGTINLTRTVVKEIIERIPERYGPHLQKFLSGAKWYDVYETIMEFEDSTPIYIGYEECQPEWFECCNTRFVFSVLISVLIMLFGISFYFIYYELDLD